MLHALPGDLVAGLGDDLTGLIDDVVGHGDLRAAVHAGQDGVHGEGEELAEDDHHLVHGHQGAADALGGRLTEEDGNDRRGTTDGEAQHDPEEVEDPDVGRDRAAQRPEEEDDGQEHDVVPAPILVGELASDRGAERGADAEQAADPALLPGGDLQAIGAVRQVHVGQGAGDDTGVVPEEQRAEGGDQGDESERALRP